MIQAAVTKADEVPCVLGLDIGSNSIGWALVRGPDTGAPEVVDMGVRVFQAGVDGDLDAGRESSWAASRRLARQLRRQTFRRVQRKRRLFKLLQEAGLLPPSSSADAVERDRVIKQVDADLLKAMSGAGTPIGEVARKWVYVLRSEGLRRPLSREELGRILYHFGERRGFKANRRTDRKSEETGKVYAGIAGVRAEKGDRTLGEYFASLDPTATRIRGRYLARSDYEDEFEKLFEAQKPHHADLTRKLHRRLRRCLFWQRPLKSQKGLIGRCSLLVNRRRCPMADPIAQEFRLLQGVNHLAIIDADGVSRGLTADERIKVLGHLRSAGDLTFAEARKLLGFKRGAVRFNLEEGGEKKLVGDRTGTAIREVLGDRWDSLDAADRAQLVGIVRGSADSAALRGQLHSLFPELLPYCDALEKADLEDTTASHCKKVLEELVVLMRDGMPYSTARMQFEATHGLGGPVEPVNQLRPVRVALLGITNPAVIRALTELRKVVNELVRLHGKPDLVRIELARDLKKPRKVRQKMALRMRDREAEREAASRQLRSVGISSPSRADIEKVLLAIECGWTCPYTGQTFGMHQLVGEHASVDVEHIFPRRYLDDSFANKTLCMAEENRNTKRDRLPQKVYGANAARYADILTRVRSFKGDLRDEKLRRFMASDVEDGFASRQLVDTSYASREAARYVGELYGGIVDVRSDLRVRTSSGRLSALLRSAWRLNGILGTDASPKGRGVDHRHHAVDAVVIALTSDATVKQVADAASRYAARGSGRWTIDVPEQRGLVDHVAERVRRVVVSHRVDRRIAGRLHEDSIYSPPRIDGNGEAYHVVRKALWKLTATEVTGDSILDPVVRSLVQVKFDSLCRSLRKTSPEDVFGDEANYPHLPNRRGAPVPIKKVRIRVRGQATKLGDESHRERYVMNDKDGLHHTAIASRRMGSREAWIEEPTSRLEVQDRHRRGSPIVRQDWGDDAEFMMHLCKGDSIELDTPEGGRDVYVVRGVAGKYIRVIPAWDASLSNSSPDCRIRSPMKLRERHPRPVVVSPTGRVHARGG